MRGYFGIGIYHTKTPVNIGTLWRSATNLGAAFVFTIGRRYKHQSSDTTKTPKHRPLFHYEDFADFQQHRPSDCQLVCIENNGSRCMLPDFVHPERAIYLLGAEDHGIPAEILERAQAVVEIPCDIGCFNVAAAGAIALYDRRAKALAATRLKAVAA